MAASYQGHKLPLAYNATIPRVDLHLSCSQQFSVASIIQAVLQVERRRKKDRANVHEPVESVPLNGLFPKSYLCSCLVVS